MNAPIVKDVIHAGQKYIPIIDGCKVHFHFQTWKLGKEKVLLDDSRVIGKKEPMMLNIGHRFKLEVWESLIKLMAVGEVARFQVKKELLFSYPIVSKTIRDLAKNTTTPKHTCAMTFHKEGIGYPDLDELIQNPTDLEFIFELLKVENVDEYEKEVWQLNDKERMDLIGALKGKGNKLYAEKRYDDAELIYHEALSICERLMIRERKSDIEWITLNKVKLPILLNYAQCKLIKQDYYAVIEHCTTVLNDDKDNEKALFRRAKAHVGAWNPNLAEKDFMTLKALNPSMAATVDKELEYIKKLRKEKEELDKDALKNLFAQN